jgi:hypothetical protein
LVSLKEGTADTADMADMVDMVNKGKFFFNIVTLLTLMRS